MKCWILLISFIQWFLPFTCFLSSFCIPVSNRAPQRGKTRSLTRWNWWTGHLNRQCPSTPCLFQSSPGACPNLYPPCCLCSRPLSQKLSTPAMTAHCLRPRRDSWPLWTGSADSRSSLQSSGLSRCQVGATPYHMLPSIWFISCFSASLWIKFVWTKSLIQ